jgi:sec-independent protein translocase protein TatB
MNIFGMGPMELLLILVIALIVFGPARLPEIMGQVGKAINDFRRATSDLSTEFTRTIQAELQEGRSVLDETKSAVTDVHSTVNSAMTGMPAPTRVSTPGDVLPTPNGINGTAPEPQATNGTLPEPIQPPLAETTPWTWETSTAASTNPAPASAAAIPAEPAAEESTKSELAKPDAPKQSPTPERTVRDELLPPY